jgi:hypothetical protein
VNILDNGKVAWAVVAVLIVTTIHLAMSSEGTVTKTFCAYNKVFVEFEEDGKRWGTLMLDWGGKPIPCMEENSHLIEKQGKIYDKSI